MWWQVALVLGVPVTVAAVGNVLCRLEELARRGSWAAGREVRRELDGVDEHGMFSPHEFMLATDELYREIDAAARRRLEALEEADRLEAKRVRERRAAEAQVARLRGELEERRVSWRRSLEEHRAELVRVVAEVDAPGALRSKGLYADLVAAQVRGYERALEEVSDEAVMRFVLAERSYVNRPGLAATVLKDRIVDGLTGGPYRLWLKQVDREREATALMAAEGKAEARAAELSGFGVVSGRARVQREVTAADLADNGRVNGSVGQSPAS